MQQSQLTKEELFRMFEETGRELREVKDNLVEVNEGLTKARDSVFELRERFAETDSRFKETDKEIKDLHKLFTGQWGKLIESLVKPSALKLFQERGINATQTFQRIESYRNGSQMEIDLLLSNENEAVVIEVKTNIKVEGVREFLDDLREFTTFFPRYKDVKLYGAVAGINIEEDADKFAYRQGLFVLTGSGEGMVRILNDENFKPKDFRTSE